MLQTITILFYILHNLHGTFQYNAASFTNISLYLCVKHIVRGQQLQLLPSLGHHRKDVVLIFLYDKTLFTLCESCSREMLGCVISSSLTFPLKQNNIYSSCSRRCRLIVLAWKEKQITSEMGWGGDVSIQSSRHTFFLPPCFMSAVHWLWMFAKQLNHKKKQEKPTLLVMFYSFINFLPPRLLSSVGENTFCGILKDS